MAPPYLPHTAPGPAHPERPGWAGPAAATRAAGGCTRRAGGRHRSGSWARPRCCTSRDMNTRAAFLGCHESGVTEYLVNKQGIRCLLQGRKRTTHGLPALLGAIYSWPPSLTLGGSGTAGAAGRAAGPAPLGAQIAGAAGRAAERRAAAAAGGPCSQQGQTPGTGRPPPVAAAAGRQLRPGTCGRRETQPAMHTWPG